MTNTRAAFEQVSNTELPQRSDVQRASRQTSVMSHFEWLLLSRPAPSSQVGPCATGARDPILPPDPETPTAAHEEPSRQTGPDGCVRQRTRDRRGASGQQHRHRLDLPLHSATGSAIGTAAAITTAAARRAAAGPLAGRCLVRAQVSDLVTEELPGGPSVGPEVPAEAPAAGNGQAAESVLCGDITAEPMPGPLP